MKISSLFRSPKVFISYKRDDFQIVAEKIHTSLCRALPARNVFLDKDGKIGLGQDWRQVLSQTIEKVDATLVIVGPNWSNLLNDSEDVVLWEIDCAYHYGSKIIPILVEVDHFPEIGGNTALATLRHYQALKIDSNEINDFSVRLIEEACASAAREVFPRKFQLDVVRKTIDAIPPNEVQSVFENAPLEKYKIRSDFPILDVSTVEALKSDGVFKSEVFNLEFILGEVYRMKRLRRIELRKIKRSDLNIYGFFSDSVEVVNTFRSEISDQSWRSGFKNAKFIEEPGKIAQYYWTALFGYEGPGLKRTQGPIFGHRRR